MHCLKCGGDLEEDIAKTGGAHCKNCIIKELRAEIAELTQDVEAAVIGYVGAMSRRLPPRAAS